MGDGVEKRRGEERGERRLEGLKEYSKKKITILVLSA
jgi:hypothetical protein